MTGCVQGAVAPIGLPDDVPVIFDEAIGRLTRCNISSGDPLCGLELAAADLIRVAHGRLAAIVGGKPVGAGNSQPDCRSPRRARSCRLCRRRPILPEIPRPRAAVRIAPPAKTGSVPIAPPCASWNFHAPETF